MADRKLLLTIVALLAAPVVASGIVAAITAGLVGFGSQLQSQTRIFVSVLIATLVIASPATLLFGGFVHRALQQSGVRSWKAHASAGAAGGLVPVVLLIAAGGLFGGSMSWSAPLLALWAVPVGALTGLFAWLIRRPDRDTPNPPTPAP